MQGKRKGAGSVGSQEVCVTILVRIEELYSLKSQVSTDFRRCQSQTAAEQSFQRSIFGLESGEAVRKDVANVTVLYKSSPSLHKDS